MKRNLRNWILFGLVLTLTVFALLAFYPRAYDVAAFPPRPGTQYWELPTGSRIGYTRLVASDTTRFSPIIYLHGGPGGCISDLAITALAPLTDDGYDLYFYDQIGSGHSARLADIAEYTVERHSKDLEAIVKQIGASKVILIGQSWGAILAMQFFAAFPAQVEKLILTGPGPILPIRKELAEIPAPDSLHLRNPLVTNREGNLKVANLRSKVVEWWAFAFQSKLAGDAEMDAFNAKLNHALNKSTVCDTANALPGSMGGGYYASIMTVHSFANVQDQRTKLKGNKVPLLLLQGQCDNQPWGYAQEYLELFPNAKLKLIPSAGHSIPTEQPDLYIQAIREFLR
jgi:proline iminopeptidase